MVNVDLDHVPSTFEAAVEAIASKLHEHERKFVLRAPSSQDAAVQTHHAFGRWLRNNWSLWDSYGAEEPIPLVQDIKARFGGIEHPDDVSGLVLAAVVARVRSEDFDPAIHARRYVEHWERSGCGPDGRKLKD